MKDSRSICLPGLHDSIRVIRTFAVFVLILSACASPLEVAQRTAQAGRTPTATPDLSAPVITPQPAGEPTQNGQDSNGQALCSNWDRSEIVPADLWDGARQLYQLTPVDPENGHPLCGTSSIPFDPYLRQAVSSDGKLLATFSYRDEYYQDGRLSLVDLTTWQVFTTTVKVDAEINSMAFNPGGDLLAFSLKPKPGAQTAPHSPLFLFDVKTRQVTDSTTLDFIPRSMHFTANGKWLAIYGSDLGGDTEQQPVAYALLLWSNHLGLAWKQELTILDGSMLVGPKDQLKSLVTWSPGLAYDSSQDVLYLVSADEQKYTTVDFLNRIIQTNIIKNAPASSLDQVIFESAGTSQSRVIWNVQKQAVLSSDAGKLYVTGLTSSTQTGDAQPNPLLGPAGLQVIDLKTTRQEAILKTRATDIQASPDGKHLFLRSWENGVPSTDVLLDNTLEPVTHLPGQYMVAAYTFTGKVVILSIQEGLTDSQVSLLDGQTFKSLFTWPAGGKPLWLSGPL